MFAAIASIGLVTKDDKVPGHNDEHGHEKACGSCEGNKNIAGETDVVKKSLLNGMMKI